MRLGDEFTLGHDFREGHPEIAPSANSISGADRPEVPHSDEEAAQNFGMSLYFFSL